VLGKVKGFSGLPEGLLEHPPAPDQLDPAHVLCLKPKQIEGVEAGGGLPIAEQTVKVRQALQAVCHSLTVEHHALERERPQGLRNGHELA
jgi:hypothetical protein